LILSCERIAFDRRCTYKLQQFSNRGKLMIGLQFNDSSSLWQLQCPVCHHYLEVRSGPKC